MTTSTVPTSAENVDTETAAADLAQPSTEPAPESTAVLDAAPAPKFATLPGVGFVGETCGIDGC